MSEFNLCDLEEIIAKQASAPLEKSWTAQLVAKGHKLAAKKLGEEAVETVIAAINNDRGELVKESADLLYHFLIVLKIAGITLDEIMAELEDRTGQSGIAEKAMRSKE